MRPMCSECIGSDEEHMTYPCPTVRAIESVIDLGGANASQPAVDHHSGDEVKVSDQSKEVQR